MKEEQIYKVIDKIRDCKLCNKQNRDIVTKMLNYMEANIDEFIECYDGVEE